MREIKIEGENWQPNKPPPYRLPYPTSKKRYEYKCPYCGHINVRYGSTKRVVCDKCKREFYTF